MPPRLRALLAHRRLALLLAASSVVLCLPALALGRVIDDMFQRVVLEGHAPELGLATTPGDLFRFVDGDPVHGRHLIHEGGLPWFTNPSIKLAFFRPISSALHRVDYALFPSSPAWMHLHSLAWLAVLVVLVTMLHRRFAAPAWVVGLGAAFFALDDAHGVPAAWIANRNALVATTFGVAALLAYDRGRRERARVATVAGPLLFACALLSGEAAIAMGGYFVAHAIFIDRASWCRRGLALLPYGIVLVAFVVAYRALGYGASGSGVYVDPTASPGRFVAALLERAPALAAAQLGPLSSDFSVIARGPIARIAWVCASLLFIVPIVAFMWPVLRRDRAAAFFGLGALLALVPVSATFANDRLLLACGVGASAVVARVIAWSRGEAGLVGAPAPSRWAARLGAALLVWHGVISAVQLPLKTAALAYMGNIVEAPHYPAGLVGKDVVMVSAPTLYGCSYTPMIEYERRGGRLQGMVCLADSEEYVDVTRDAANSLLLRPAHGFGRPMMDALFREEQQRSRVGQRVSLRGCVLEVREIDDTGRPMLARVTFEEPMETPTRIFTAWTRNGVERFVLPALGDTVRVPGVTMMHLMAGR